MVKSIKTMFRLYDDMKNQDEILQIEGVSNLKALAQEEFTKEKITKGKENEKIKIDDH